MEDQIPPVIVKQKKLHKSRPEIYNWAKMRSEFIEGIAKVDAKAERWWPTLREISEMNSVPYPRVRKKAAAERWTNKREAAQLVAMQERQRRRAKQIAKNALDFDEKAHNVAKIGIAMITTRLAEIAKEVQVKQSFRDDAIQRMASGQAVQPEELYSAVRFRELEGLANAADRFQSIGMKALGTDVQRIDVMGGGETTNVSIVNISQEMSRDDPERMAAMLEAMGEAGLLPEELVLAISAGEDAEGQTDPLAAQIIDGEVVPETPADSEQFPQDMVGEVL